MNKWLLIGLGLIAAALGAAIYYKNVLKDIIAKFEGLSLVPYQDAAGYWTIGYGHKIVAGDPYYPVGNVTKITQEEADRLLDEDTANAKAAVEHFVTVTLSTPQLQALTSFVFNVGESAFQHSTLLAKLNAGDYAGAASEFDKWTHAGGQVLTALVSRRADEKQLFLS